MKHLTLTMLFLFALISLRAQNTNQEFTAIQEASVRLGKAWDYSYDPLKTPIEIKINDNKLTMIPQSGKIFWEQEFTKTIKTKETKEDGKIIELKLALEYEETEGYISHVIFEYRSELGQEYYTLKTPYIGPNGAIISYSYFSN